MKQLKSLLTVLLLSVFYLGSAQQYVDVATDLLFKLFYYAMVRLALAAAVFAFINDCSDRRRFLFIATAFAWFEII